MTKVAFAPIHGAHAIVEAVFIIGFSNAVFSSAEIVAAAKKELSPEFSLIIDSPSIDIEIEDSGPKFRESVPGVVFRKEQDGKLLWALRIQGDTLSIHCVDFQQWDDVYTGFERYVEIVSRFLGNELTISAFQFKVLNRFVLVGDLSDYDAKVVLREGSPYLPMHVFDRGARWRTSINWFVDEEKNSVLGYEVNVESAEVGEPQSEKVVISIDFSSVMRPADEADKLPVFQVLGNGLLDVVPKVRPICESFKLANKSVVTSLLNDAYCEKINIKV